MSPDHAAVRNVPDLRPVQTHDAAHLGGRVILFAVSDVNILAVNYHGSVQPAFGQLERPDSFTGPSRHAVDVTVGVTGDQQTPSIDDRDYGRRIGGVERFTARLRPPLHLAGMLVESHVAVARFSLAGVPVGQDVHVTDDQPVLVHNGCLKPASVAAVARKSFSERLLPEHLPVTAQAKKLTAGAVRVDVARFRITHDGGPAQAGLDNVGVEHVKLVFP